MISLTSSSEVAIRSLCRSHDKKYDKSYSDAALRIAGKAPTRSLQTQHAQHMHTHTEVTCLSVGFTSQIEGAACLRLIEGMEY